MPIIGLVCESCTARQTFEQSKDMTQWMWNTLQCVRPFHTYFAAFVIFGTSLLIFDVLTWLMTQSQIIKFTSNAIQSAFRDTCTVNGVEESHAAIKQSRLPSRGYNSTAYWSTNCCKQFSRHNYKIWSASWNVFEVLRCIYLRPPWIDPSTATRRIYQSVREMIEQVIFEAGSRDVSGTGRKSTQAYSEIIF